MAHEEHYVAPQSDNPLSDGFGFVFAILSTLILSELLKTVGTRLASGVEDFPWVFAPLVVALLVEISRAAIDNYYVTENRENPLHEDLIRFELVRYGVHFVNVCLLFAATMIVTTSLSLPGESSGPVPPVWLATSAVFGLVGLRYLCEGLWQVTGVLRFWRHSEFSFWATLRADEELPMRDSYVAEARERLPNYTRLVGGFVAGLGAASLLLFTESLLLSQNGVRQMVTTPIGEWTLVVVASGVIITANWYYVSFWYESYYAPLFGVNRDLRTTSYEALKEHATNGERERRAVFQELVRRSDDVRPDSEWCGWNVRSDELDKPIPFDELTADDLFEYVDRDVGPVE